MAHFWGLAICPGETERKRSNFTRGWPNTRLAIAGEERRHAGTYVPSPRDRRQVVDVLQGVELCQGLEHTQGEGGRADPASGQCESNSVVSDLRSNRASALPKLSCEP